MWESCKGGGGSSKWRSRSWRAVGNEILVCFDVRQKVLISSSSSLSATRTTFSAFHTPFSIPIENLPGHDVFARRNRWCYENEIPTGGRSVRDGGIMMRMMMVMAWRLKASTLILLSRL